MYKYLDKINSPEDLKVLSNEEILLLASEIRTFLTEEVPKTGGHLASNLGVVELTLALYKVFDAPKDKIIFDVGHQAYVSKILTGRRESFSTLRCENGISGFPKLSESEYDAFGTGHSSTSLSAALGIARASKLAGSDAYTIAVVGDGAFSGGLVYEAMNNVDNDLRLIVILNENEMSISPSVGNMAHMISKIRSKENYFKVKNAVQRTVEKIPLIGKGTVAFMRKTKRMLKNAIFNTNIVENFGFTYYGPIDGNDYVTVERLIAQARKHGGSAFIHIKTKKGKGYAPAEENPSQFHMVKAGGKRDDRPTFSQSLGSVICDIAENNLKVCGITAAMTDGTGLCEFFKKYPDRAFDVGIAEGHAVTFAAGLSVSGYTPVFAVYSSFLQRSFDNYIHDIALQKLHCVFAVDRAGLSPDDGATHHGILDVSMMSLVSDSVIFSPITLESQKKALFDSISASEGIYTVRYPKGSEDASGLVKVRDWVYTDAEFDCENVIVTYGRIFREALYAKEMLTKEGIRCGILVLEKLTPYKDSFDIILEFCKDSKKIAILEEGILSGGFGQNILTLANSYKGSVPDVTVLAIDGDIPCHGALESLYRKCGISRFDIASAIKGEQR